jgi:hypothetical protein
MQRAFKDGPDRIFWATIAIACGGEASSLDSLGKGSVVQGKRYGTLLKARNDLDAFYEYYRPMRLRLSEADFSVPGHPGAVFSPGYFDITVHLNNPTTRKLQNSIRRIREWVAVNQEDPEFVSLQVNLCFSGHGDVSPDKEKGFIVLADGAFDASDLVRYVHKCLPEDYAHDQACRLDLFLDCCHSGAVARSIYKGLRDIEEERFALGQVYCACLDDEEAFETEHLSHSLFTFAFLNECSRRQPKEAANTNLGLRDLGWYTKTRSRARGQHPLLFDFSRGDKSHFNFPSAYHLSHPPGGDPNRVKATLSGLDMNAYYENPIGAILELARRWRDECGEIEELIRTKPSIRTQYSREEILRDPRFPFV